MSNVSLFDEEFLRKLEYLKIVSSNLVPGHQKGEHRARKRGSGLEFCDYRQYVAGDDTRSVDWRAYLRLDKLLLRIFEEEADLPIYIFVDASRSMERGEPPKFDYARKVAAAFSYIGLLNLDRVNLIAFSDGITEEMSSRRGKEQVWRAFRFLEAASTRGATSLEKAFKSFFSARRRRGLVVVVSDFLDGNGLQGGFNLLRYLRHDVFAIQIVSAEEVSPELPDEVVLMDIEDRTEERIRVTPGLLASYKQKFEAHARQIESTCSKNGWGYVRTVTDVPFEDIILQVFRQERFLK